LWIVNIKKSIASQLQLDVTGVRNEGAAFNYKAATKDGEKATLTVLEVFIRHKNGNFVHCD
jgi:hypothetical protein